MVWWTKWAIGGAVTVATLVAAKKVAARFHVPARAMSMAQAIDEMHAYASSGAVDIVSEGMAGSMPRMVIGGNIAGVQYFYIVGHVQRKTIDNVDPRFGVFLVRLSQLLHSLGVREVDDLGITHGSADRLGDAHNQGRALDIAGVRGHTMFGGAIDLNVTRDWGKKPASAVGTYRLSRGDPGYAMFKAIYQFATIEGQDRTERADQGGPPSDIGFASYILTPDHPSPGLRRDHNDHIHMQVGPTNV